MPHDVNNFYHSEYSIDDNMIDCLNGIDDLLNLDLNITK